ncbi:Nem1-Spo7 phosphatase catalytic subunit NEM1 [Aspergillus chevalieri]|uniref:Nuclear envelope morphology protein 1 n=1 Tax=Aspergillus chevalieri TaxID=182096 RepID=A0A7R7VLM6_ASPCH|nr:nuclear envelope morphology protein 1 [Aspergillus chevalieri]BCR86950.1 nuclear envelope morphology protein 1 [Aspergillus chevalieri]
MNSLNILSSRVIGQSSNSNRIRQRSRSQGDNVPPSKSPPDDVGKHRSYSDDEVSSNNALEKQDGDISESTEDIADTVGGPVLNEKSPLLLREIKNDGPLATRSSLELIAQRIFDAITETIKFILSTLAAPGVFAAQCFREDDGHYSPMAPVRKLRRSIARGSHRKGTSKGGSRQGEARNRRSTRKSKSHIPRESIASSTSESEGSVVKGLTSGGKSRTSNKAKISSSGQTSDAPRRSIRIKLHNEEALQRQRQRRSQSADLRQSSHDDTSRSRTVSLDSIKSPTSPSSSVHRITKYPHAPAPPRPLIPPRLPSYTAAPRNAKIPQKTLVLDLDETLIHSLAKGGRMSSGHMVEVKLSTPMTTALTPGGPPTMLGPQHPILYYVHKRPHCDDFLRKVCKWFNLVVFTASVQEYADPVIDWLEQERKYFQARYYRQHCTFRNGAYIKDLSAVEPDLSKVMILDNSPMSYIFHEDNAIPIEGWINDPTDNGLLHLIPMLEALQYVTDVRALLALRRGEAEA